MDNKTPQTKMDGSRYGELHGRAEHCHRGPTLADLQAEAPREAFETIGSLVGEKMVGLWGGWVGVLGGCWGVWDCGVGVVLFVVGGFVGWGLPRIPCLVFVGVFWFCVLCPSSASFRHASERRGRMFRRLGQAL